MALLAHGVLDEAVEKVGTADALVARMEPHLHKRYGDSAIYAYTNKRAVPPGDVLLAAALTAGISLDDKLGIARQEAVVETQVDELRAEMAQLREAVANLQGQLVGQDVAQHAPQDAMSTEPGREARRREWARRSPAPPPTQPDPPSRRAGRDRRT
jgi:hypothetical protein